MRRKIIASVLAFGCAVAWWIALASWSSRHSEEGDVANTLNAHDERTAGDVPGVILAAEAAERAWLLRQTPENAWSRAVARETLHVASQAIIAWSDYLQLDPHSDGSRDATGRIRRLSAVTDSRRWKVVRKQLADRNPAAIEEAVCDLPQQVRVYAEEELLAAWSDAVKRNDSKAAECSLRLAERIGHTLAGFSGEGLLADSVNAIVRAGNDPRRLQHLAAAHTRYVEGKMLFGRQQMGAAASTLEDAARQLRAADSPFTHRAALYANTAHYYAADLDRAERNLRELGRSLGSNATRYATLSGQIDWVLGLIAYSRGHNNEALARYRSALSSFERSRERENGAALETLLGETYRAIGQKHDAWLYHERALRAMERLGATRRSHAILTDAAIAAAAWNAPLTALIFQSNLVTLARVSHDPVSLCDALVGLATYAASAGEKSTALSALEEAERHLRDVSDPSMRNRTRANLLAAETLVRRTFDPARAADAAASAIAEMDRLGHRVRLIQLELEAGRAVAALGRSTEALKYWNDGIRECDRQRADLSNVDYRQTYFEQCRALFDEAVGLLSAQGRHVEAEALTDQSRARGLIDVLAPQRSQNPTGALPEGLTIVEFSVLADRVLIWTIDRDRIRGTSVTLGRSALERSVDHLIDARGEQMEFEEHSARLYDLLIRPIESALRTRVVFVPDLAAYRIPFAALFDARRRQYLIERHEVMVSPSVSLLKRSGVVPWPGAKRALLIEAGAADLQGATREIAEISSLYPEGEVLKGVAFTREDVLKAMEAAEIVHFAGHAVRASEQADPALVLHAGSANETLLYPREIAGLSLRNARMVILGACGTASGRIGNEGPLSIARAFLAGGAERVMATLWDVDDRETARLVTRFHRRLSSHADPLQALRAVQLEAIRDSDSPSHWAAFEILQSQL